MILPIEEVLKLKEKEYNLDETLTNLRIQIEELNKVKNGLAIDSISSKDINSQLIAITSSNFGSSDFIVPYELDRFSSLNE